MVERFNLRVYGLVMNNKAEILLFSERRNGFHMLKFPGGGVEYGEGIIDALKREFKEELDVEVLRAEFFYFNEEFQDSYFQKSDQLVSFYYLVEVDQRLISTLPKIPLDASDPSDLEQASWQSLSTVSSEQLTFPIDRSALERLKLWYKDL